MNWLAVGTTVSVLGSAMICAFIYGATRHGKDDSFNDFLNLCYGMTGSQYADLSNVDQEEIHDEWLMHNQTA